MSILTLQQEEALYRRLAEHMANGGDTTLSRRAIQGYWDFKDRLQAIFNGPIPSQAPDKHGHLLGERGQRASH